MSKFGATGKFPRGMLNAKDEGGLAIGIAADKGKVIINFGKEVAWIGLDPQGAADLAGSIIRHARKAAKEAGVTLEIEL